MLNRMRPPACWYFSKITTSYPSGIRSFATVSDAGPAPIRAMRLPFLTAGAVGSRPLTSSRRSDATRLSRQIATGFPSTRPRRHAGSHGRSQVRPRIPGKTFDSRLSR